MRALIPPGRSASSHVGDISRKGSNSAQRLLEPLFTLAENSDSIIAGSVGGIRSA
jgi:hypothetical protein